ACAGVVENRGAAHDDALQLALDGDGLERVARDLRLVVPRARAPHQQAAAGVVVEARVVRAGAQRVALDPDRVDGLRDLRLRVHLEQPRAQHGLLAVVVGGPHQRLAGGGGELRAPVEVHRLRLELDLVLVVVADDVAARTHDHRVALVERLVGHEPLLLLLAAHAAGELRAAVLAIVPALRRFERGLAVGHDHVAAKVETVLVLGERGLVASDVRGRVAQADVALEVDHARGTLVAAALRLEPRARARDRDLFQEQHVAVRPTAAGHAVRLDAVGRLGRGPGALLPRRGPRGDDHRRVTFRGDDRGRFRVRPGRPRGVRLRGRGR